MQEFQFKPKNHIHYQTRKGLLKGSYIIKSIDKLHLERLMICIF